MNCFVLPMCVADGHSRIQGLLEVRHESCYTHPVGLPYRSRDSQQCSGGHSDVNHGSQDAEGWSTAGGVGLEGHVIYTTPL